MSSWARGALALALVAVAAAAAPARADEVKLPNTRAVLHVPAGWTKIGADEPGRGSKTVGARGLVIGYRGDGGIVLAVTRAGVPNVDAYRTAARDAYVDQIERGLAARVAGYRRVSRKLAEQRGTPALDLEARRADGATIVVRVLLFWTYALSLAIEVPPGADVKAAREVAARFAPAAAPPKP